MFFPCHLLTGPDGHSRFFPLCSLARLSCVVAGFVRKLASGSMLTSSDLQKGFPRLCAEMLGKERQRHRTRAPAGALACQTPPCDFLASQKSHLAGTARTARLYPATSHHSLAFLHPHLYGPKPAQGAPRRPYTAPRRPPSLPKAPQEDFKPPRDAPKTPKKRPRRIQNGPRPPKRPPSPPPSPKTPEDERRDSPGPSRHNMLRRARWRIFNPTRFRSEAILAQSGRRFLINAFLHIEPT